MDVQLSQASQVEHWSTQFLCKPWRNGARGPDSFDCYGLVWWVYLKLLNIKLPLYAGVDALNGGLSARLIKGEIEPGFGPRLWQRTENPAEFDVATMAQAFNPFTHVGIYTPSDGGLIIHAWESKSVVASRPSALLKTRFKRIHYFKYNGLHS